MDLAVRGYAEAMAADPGNVALALRTYRQALEAGDTALAMRSARVLDQSGVLPRDGTLLFVLDALGRKDWNAARKLADRLKVEGNFAFLSPFLSSWISTVDGPYSAPAVDEKSQFGALTARYLDEHVALQALARKDVAAAKPAILRALSVQTSTLAGLRIALARRLVALGQREDAIALLALDDPALRSTKLELANARQVSELALTPKQGFGRILARLADDVGEGDSRPLALALARLASISDPASGEMRLLLARQLVLSGYADIAVVEVGKIQNDSPWASAANNLKIAALAQTGKSEQALALARDTVARSEASAAQYLQLANLLSEMQQFGPAVDAYRAAQGRFAKGAVPWSLYLLEGSALERSGRWSEAKVALDKAMALAPNEPVVLNYLGYAQVERRQNVPEALLLLHKAQALRPEDPAIADSLGWAHFVAGDPRNAVPMLEKAAAGAPGDATINEHLGDALWAVGRRYEARYAWAAARVFAEGDAATRINGKVRSGFRPEFAAP
ncbi:hypothetical protein [Sphingobium sp. SCG-1]|uniref:hypothetical protein n=1 Tax=Sphingobium sp. SCG-1 TaxID=2072936 RepID=UPI001CB99F07|nr:hypothetical protein [Sphingobium sp. SCG-1]